jgi:hypothetical protein
MEKIYIKTVKELKDLIEDLDDSFPIGTYHANYWNPTLEQGKSMCITQEGLAVDIDYSHN